MKVRRILFWLILLSLFGVAVAGWYAAFDRGDRLTKEQERRAIAELEADNWRKVAHSKKPPKDPELPPEARPVARLSGSAGPTLPAPVVVNVCPPVTVAPTPGGPVVEHASRPPAPLPAPVAAGPTGPNWTLEPGHLGGTFDVDLAAVGSQGLARASMTVVALTPAGQVVRNLEPEEIDLSAWVSKPEVKRRYGWREVRVGLSSASELVLGASWGRRKHFGLWGDVRYSFDPDRVLTAISGYPDVPAPVFEADRLSVAGGVRLGW